LTHYLKFNYNEIVLNSRESQAFTLFCPACNHNWGRVRI